MSVVDVSCCTSSLLFLYFVLVTNAYVGGIQWYSWCWCSCSCGLLLVRGCCCGWCWCSCWLAMVGWCWLSLIYTTIMLFLFFIILILLLLTRDVSIPFPPNTQYDPFGGYDDCCCPVYLNSSCAIPFGQATPDEESDKIKELEDCANMAISCYEDWSSVDAKGLRLYTLIHFVIEVHFCYTGVWCVCVCVMEVLLYCFCQSFSPTLWHSHSECMSCILHWSLQMLDA